MTEQLRQAVELIEQLPEAAQAEAAKRISDLAAELADQRWDVLLNDTRTETLLARLAANALGEDDAGVSHDLEDDL